jgi:hypothetical protein
MGKAQYLLSMGHAAGGVDQIVKFQMERLGHILPTHSEWGGFYATGSLRNGGRIEMNT